MPKAPISSASAPRIPPAALRAAIAKARKLRQAGQLAAARKVIGGLLQQDASLAEAWAELGTIARAASRPDIALQSFRRAHGLAPRDYDIAVALADTLAHLDRAEDAAQAWATASLLKPAEVAPHAERAVMLQRLGRFEEAEEILTRLLRKDPNDGVLYRILSATRKLAPDDPLIAQMEAAWASKKVKGRARAHLGHALAKAMEDTGQHDRVFAYLDPANAEMRRLYPDDSDRRQAGIERLQALFAPVDFTRPRGPSRPGFRPILVTGLPRSGTTLVEEILARHPAVCAAGEATGRVEQVESLLTGADGALRSPDDLPDSAFESFAREYEAQLRARVAFDSHVTDKSLNMPLVLGMVPLAVPETRILLIRRDPRDIGLSIYRNLFAEGGHRYATDLRAIARRIRLFEDLLEFWKARLGACITEIGYEDLVADPETVSRQIVAAAGLDWDPACLDPKAVTRTVGTLSLHQVRQPIYRDAARGWRRYARELAPLIEELGLEDDT